MNTLAIAALICASLFANCGADSDSGMGDEWEKFKNQYNKTYETNETEKYRKNIWLQTLKMIKEHNKGNHSYKLAMNNFGDMNASEYQQMLCTRYPGGQTNTTRSNSSNSTLFALDTITVLPYSVDWRKAGYVTEVKDQGRHCGSCWAFSATGSLEGQHFKKTGMLVSLSEQNLVDCSTKFGNQGCRGGWAPYAFDYIKANGGIDTNASYPYKAKEGPCKFKKENIGAKVTGYVRIKPWGNESALQRAVATVGPISVSIDSRSKYFKHYSTGIYNNPDCSSTYHNHAVLVVGYGTTKDGEDYWLVKNSWGTKNWGEDGYIRMSRNKDNQCGIATNALYPLVPTNDQEKQATTTKATTTKATTTYATTTYATTTNGSGIRPEGSTLCVFVVLVFWQLSY